MTSPVAEPEAPAPTVPVAAQPRAPGGTPAQGIALMVVSTGLFAIMDALAKWLSARYPTLELVFFRSLFGFLPLGVYIWRTGTAASLRTRRPGAHFLRSLFGIFSLSGFFYAYGHLPLANVIAIGFAAPVFVTALSVPLLGEPVGPRRWTAVVVGFLGVLIIVRPDAGGFGGAGAIALAATVGYALVIIALRQMSRTETTGAITFYYALSSILVTGAALPFLWVTPDLHGWLLLMALGLIGGVAQITMTNAYRFADAALVAPFDYTTVIWAALLGFAIWSEVPAASLWLGVAILVTSGLYILFREARLGLPRGIARRFQTRR